MKQIVTALEYDVKTGQTITKEVEMEMPDPTIIENERRVQEIKQRLAEIDTESIRPLRATVDGTATEFDVNKLSALETEATNLRTEMASLLAYKS